VAEPLAYRVAIRLLIYAEVLAFILLFVACIPLWLIIYPIFVSSAWAAATARECWRFLAGDFTPTTHKEQPEV
jgi:hypothetical protein